MRQVLVLGRGSNGIYLMVKGCFLATRVRRFSATKTIRTDVVGIDHDNGWDRLGILSEEHAGSIFRGPTVFKFREAPQPVSGKTRSYLSGYV